MGVFTLRAGEGRVERMSFLEFLWRAVWREVGMVTRAIQIATVTLPALMTLIVGVSGGEWTQDVWPAWVWLLITCAALLVTFMYGVTMRAFTLEKEREPKIFISDPREDFMPWPKAQSGERANHYYYIAVSNISSLHIKNCSVRDIKFENNRGHIAPLKGRYMSLRSERFANRQSHTFTREIDLRGKGDTIEVDICSMDEGEPDSRIIMYNATRPTDQYPNAITRELFPHYLTISVTAGNLPVPEVREFKIYVTSNGDLKMEPI